ncbi:YfiR family protein [Pseudohongiella spirulinae]|nr:YfiR family protein [Pseudohongiella spirulinae]
MKPTYRFISLLRLITLVTATSLATSVSHAQSGPITRSDVGSEAVARFLMNFGRFIDWPAGSVTSSEFQVCVLGDDHLGRSLDQNVNGKKAGDKSMIANRIPASDLGAAANCQIVWVSASESNRIGEITSALEGKSVLTVSEVDQFLESGGMIGLSEDRGSRVSIRMNKSLIEGAGLNIREQLMRAIQ